ncbi:hypothetical protein N7492_001571 [Penicillium capsulatum]|uniref:Alpha-glucosidase n=1 Tax=Penicillium capsulatum TaxID=69766 RepID=A0A9W9M001_9EURO|nr:hypothetical protein N7492_001571 [Penicillium capsulatum]KAJ6129377.1 hypothetical protein N7512_002157 [Penicillium capsulatum]
MHWGKIWTWCTLVVSSLASQGAWDLGNGFSLTVNRETNHVLVTHGKQTIWDTVPGQPFLSASSGVDAVVGSSGNFNITQVDRSQCTNQEIHQVSQQKWPGTLNGNAAEIQGSLSGCGDATNDYSFVLFVPAAFPDRIAFHANVCPGTGADLATKLFLTYRSSSFEDFYGLGAQASFASLKNQSVPIFSREQGVGRGDQPTTDLENEDSYFSGGDEFTTYAAVPQYISSKARVFHLSQESTAYTNFDFRQPRAVTVRYHALTVDGYFMQADSILDGITMLTEYTGRMPELPRWVDTGAVLGIQGGQDKVNRIVKQGLAQSCPIAAVWLQDWSGTHSQSASYLTGLNISRLWWNWESDEKLYPTWTKFVQALRDDHNVRTLSYINPFLANVSTKPGGYRRDLFLEATRGGFMIQNSTTNETSIVSSGPGIEAGIVDLTNSAARTWFKKVLADEVWSANVSGYMADFGEYTPVTPDTRFANRSTDPFFYHNEYPRAWATLHHSLSKDIAAVNDSILFHRSSSMSANRHMNLYWAGDQDTTWGVNDGIKSAVTVMGHMGLSGYAHGHMEIGGYTTTWTNSGVVNRTAELLGRWGELTAVTSAVFRSHEGNVPQVNAQFYTNSSTYAYHAYNARMFRSLATYRRRILDTESKNKGWPLLRMPVIYHPDDDKAKQISYESFYLGADLYVAPVLDSGHNTVNVYLPGQKEFTHVWTGRKYQGGQTVRVSAPYGKPAVFLVGEPKHNDLKEFFDFVLKEKDTIIRV